MALAPNIFGNKPGFGGRHSVVLPVGTVAGVYEIPVSPGKKTTVNISNAGAQAFDLVFYLFTPNEAAKLGITRAKALIESTIVATSYSKSALAGVRTIGIELLGASTSALTFEVLEAKN